ncbi:MAG: hypothetical protein LKG24_00955 [Lacticaseibacillus songhuajiangensis]|jgi:hypothetical protein|nr:hypothetical protein [Lacticaseibacillus songhuajiangensis]
MAQADVKMDGAAVPGVADNFETIKITGFTDDQLKTMGVDASEATDGYIEVSSQQLAKLDATNGSSTDAGTPTDDSAASDPASDTTVVTADEASTLKSMTGVTLHSPTEQPTDYTGLDYMGAPTLYNTTADDLTGTGVGSMPEAIWSIKRSASAFPTLSMSYPLSGPLATQIKSGMVIMADGGFDWKRQLFRIDSVEPDMSEGAEPILNIEATHVAGDIINDVLTKSIELSNVSILQSFSAVLEMLAEPMPRATFYTDIVTVGNVSWAQDTSIQDIMFGRTVGGTDMESLYDGEWVFDNYNFRFLKHGGIDRGVIVKPGKNLLSYEITESLDDTYTAVYPYSRYTPDTSDGGGDASNIEDYKGVGTIQWLGSGGVPVYDTPFKGQKLTGKTLKNGTSWKVFSQVETGGVGDHVWYCLGGNQWIDASYFTFDKDGNYDIDYAVNKVTGYGTIGYNLDNALSKRHTETLKESGTIKWLGTRGCPVWDSPFSPQKKTGKTLKNGDDFKVFEKATDEKDQTWYCLGGKQWILSSYITFDKKTDYESTIASNSVTGYCTIVGHKIKTKKTVVTGRYKSGKNKGKVKTKTTTTKTKLGADVYNKPLGKATGRVLKVGTRWKIFSVADGGDGNTWYNLSRNQWIKSSDVSFKAKKDIEPEAKEDRTSEKEAGVATVYTKPDGKTAVKTLKSGTQWKIFGQATTSDGTWYNLGGNQWINSSDMTFDGKTDIEPQAPEDDADDTEPAELLVTLDEGMVVADGCDGYERQRIVTFDASEYNVQDQDTLRKVTAAYIADNRVGKPDYSLTVAYSEMTGELARLSWLGFYDYCVVYLPQTEKDTYGEVTELDWDGNLHRNTTVTIGNRPPAIAHELDVYAQAAADAADKSATVAAGNAKSDADAAVANLKNVTEELMTASIKSVTDAFTKQANEFHDDAMSSIKDLHDELNNNDDTITATLEKYKTGFDEKVSALDGKTSEALHTISGFEDIVNDPTTGLSSLHEQLAGLNATVITQEKNYSDILQKVNGIEADVGNGSVDSRLEIFANKIGTQVKDQIDGVTNTIEQQIEDGVSSITLAVDSEGTGIQVIGPNGKQGSVVYINADAAVAKALRTTQSLDLATADGSNTAFTAWGVTVHGSATHSPTVEIGTPSINGKLHVNGTTYIDGKLHIVEPSSSQGAYLYYASNGFKGSGLYVHFNTGNYLLASYNGKTNLKTA